MCSLTHMEKFIEAFNIDLFGIYTDRSNTIPHDQFTESRVQLNFCYFHWLHFLILWCWVSFIKTQKWNLKNQIPRNFISTSKLEGRGEYAAGKGDGGRGEVRKNKFIWKSLIYSSCDCARACLKDFFKCHRKHIQWYYF